MKAAVSTRYGSPDVIMIDEVPTPVPGPTEVLVKIHATTVSRTDCGNLRAHPFFARLFTGLLRPKRPILGMDFAGEIEAVGEEVTSFSAGDRVFGLTPNDHGGHAEYICLDEKGTLAAMPAGVPFDEVVVCEGTLYADSNLRAAGVGAGDRVLIYGASGAIGTAGVQLAKSYGAHVTAVVAMNHLQLVESLGADHLIDYTVHDFTKTGETYDLVFDAVGRISFFRCRKLLKPGGVFAATDFGPRNQNVLPLLLSPLLRNKRFVLGIPRNRKRLVESVRTQIEAGSFRAVIDRRYPLHQIVDAFRYVETGQKTGIVVINVAPQGQEATTFGQQPVP